MSTITKEALIVDKKLIEICQQAKQAEVVIRKLNQRTKNDILKDCADALRKNCAEIIRANKEDVESALASGIKGAFIDRLTLDESRINAMADGLLEVAALHDPIGEVYDMKSLPNGLTVGKKKVPLGVIGIIYESRPNVTADAFGLCFKTNNVVILKGGKESLKSNMSIVNVFKDTLCKYDESDILKNCVMLIDSTDRETTMAFMKMNKYVDVLIPRGSGRLINSVIENATIPVIETGVGNCHIFVDESADIEKSIAIVINAKVQRPGVCNAAEKLLVHKNIAKEFLPKVCEQLNHNIVELRGDKNVQSLISYVGEATEEDWFTEYSDLIMGIKIVANVDEAINHISKYSSHHSEAILTESYANSQKFLDEVDSAAVYINASTRFTDGNEMGLGAEIGISTQKLHARGPMGLNEMTTSKYIVYGNWQIRS